LVRPRHFYLAVKLDLGFSILPVATGETGGREQRDEPKGSIAARTGDGSLSGRRVAPRGSFVAMHKYSLNPGAIMPY
jgi:hypothetical protein